ALLLLAAVRDQGRADDVEPDRADQLRGAGAGQLLVDDDLLGPRGAAPAVLARPRQPDQARRVQAPLPVAQERDALAELVRQRAGRGEVLGEEGAPLPGHALLGGVAREPHGRSSVRGSFSSPSCWTWTMLSCSYAVEASIASATCCATWRLSTR